MTVMTADPRIQRTKAEEALAAAYLSVRETLPGGKTYLATRDRAFAAFQMAGLPHRRIEAWRYTDLRSLVRSIAPVAGAGKAVEIRALAAGDPLAGLDRARLVIVNGVYRPDLSDRDDLPAVTVESLADVLAKEPARIGKLFAGVDDAIVALNTAMMHGGIVLTVAKDAAVERPIEIAHLTAGDAGVSVTTRSQISVGSNATVRIIESHRGSDAANQVNSAIELDVGDGARVAMARVQAESDSAQHLASFAVRIGRDARFDHVAVNAGAALARWQAFVDIAGTGTEVGFHGATMLSGREHNDVTLFINHAAPHGRSRELYKSVVDDAARGVFQGRIIVKPGAQKTDARMMTQALLLSDMAEFDAKPELEIFADDVQCGHGATSGRIDETQLFYLMARGVPHAEAERLLIEAFLADPIDAVGDEKIAEALKGTITRWVGRRGRSVEAA